MRWECAFFAISQNYVRIRDRSWAVQSRTTQAPTAAPCLILLLTNIYSCIYMLNGAARFGQPPLRRVPKNWQGIAGACSFRGTPGCPSKNPLWFEIMPRAKESGRLACTSTLVRQLWFQEIANV